MKRLAVGAGIVATIVVGLWATTVFAWLRHFDPSDFHE